MDTNLHSNIINHRRLLIFDHGSSLGYKKFSLDKFIDMNPQLIDFEFDLSEHSYNVVTAHFHVLAKSAKTTKGLKK